MIILAIESSCDETSAAVLVDGDMRSNVIAAQLIHEQYGGVVPELAPVTIALAPSSLVMLCYPGYLYQRLQHGDGDPRSLMETDG